MKIMMVYELFWPAMGGIESWIGNVSKILVRRGHEVTVVTGNIGEQEYEEYEGVKIQRIDYLSILRQTHRSGTTTFSRQAFWVPIAENFIRRNEKRFDIIHAHSPPSAFASVLAGVGRKTVFHWHGTHHGYYNELYNPLLALGLDTTEHIAAGLPFKLCVTADKYTKRLAVQHMRADPARIIPVANGVDVNLFRPCRITPQQVGWGDEGPFIIAARRFVGKNGLEFLILAMAEIIKDKPKAKLMLYGAGPCEAQMREIVRQKKLENNVFFKGNVPHWKLPSLYNASDIVAAPSIIEATSLGCLEAMACGKPLLTCAVGGIPEILTTGAAFLVRPKNVQDIVNGLKFLLCEMNDGERRRMGEIGRINVQQNFTWERVVDNMLEVFKQIEE